MAGVPRITVKYTLQMASKIFNTMDLLPPLSTVDLTSATKNPKITPKIAAKKVTVKVVPSPSVI